MEQVNDANRYLISKYYFNERSYVVPGGTAAQTQFYNLPPQVKKLINATVAIGSVLWQPKECPTRADWDALNVQTFYNDFPLYFFVYNGQVGIWPTPSANGNVITMNYKTRIVDLIMPDVTATTLTFPYTVALTGTLLKGATSATLNANWSLPSGTYQVIFSSGDINNIVFTNGLTPITWTNPLSANATATLTIKNTNSVDIFTATAGSFAKWMVGNWLIIPYTQTGGDQQWYQIGSYLDSTHITLANEYTGATSLSAVTCTIGQCSILPEDYQNLPLFYMGMVYYSTRFPDQTRFNLYKDLYTSGIAQLDSEFGSKTTSVVLQDSPLQVINPNLFQSNISGH